MTQLSSHQEITFFDEIPNQHSDLRYMQENQDLTIIVKYTFATKQPTPSRLYGGFIPVHIVSNNPLELLCILISEKDRAIIFMVRGLGSVLALEAEGLFDVVLAGRLPSQ